MKKQVRIVKDMETKRFHVEFFKTNIFGFQGEWKDILHKFGFVHTRYFNTLEAAQNFAKSWDGTEKYSDEFVVDEFVVEIDK